MDQPVAVVVDELDPADEALRAEEAKAVRQSYLDALAITLAENRSKAISAHEASGLGLEWEEDEEHYEGIDDANRGERRSWRGKPPGNTGQQEQTRQATSSTVFINITRPYVDAASARVADMLLPTDDRAWSLQPTPVPDLAEMAEGRFPDRIVRQVAAENPDRRIAEQKLHAAVDQAVQQMDEARKKAEKAQTRIEDWQTECQFHAEVRKVIECTALIGCGVLKGPVPVNSRKTAYLDGALVVRESIQPASYAISPWNFYPDPACGENIHNGSHCWERDDITDRGLMALIGAPGYLEDQIQLVLSEGALKASRLAPDRPLPDGAVPDKSGMFEIWYFHGMLKREDAAMLGCDCADNEYMSVPVQVTMVNNRVIRATLDPLGTGELPYDVMVWQKRTGSWAGIGVSRQIRTPQEIVTAAGRNLMDNAGRAGGPQVVVQQGIVVPHDGVYEVTPWKFWLAAADADSEHIDKAFRFVVIPMLQAELMPIIQLGMKLAEDVTGLPLLLQGQQGNAPETLGGQQLVNNNASTVLRRIARTFDDRITEPYVRRYYAYLLIEGEDDEKGDFVIDARGSSALVQRDIENQAIAQMVQMVGNPTFGIDPRKWAEELLKSKHLDPKRFSFDDDKWQQIVENMAKGPQDPALQIAQMNAQVKQQDIQARVDAGNADRELKLVIAQIDAELAQAGLTVDQQKVLSEIKGRLSDTVIKVRAQMQMQANEQPKQLSKPAVEPAGRAANGKAYIN